MSKNKFKFTKKIILIFCVITISLSSFIVGCNFNTERGGLSVWGALNDAKVIQDPAYDKYHQKESASFSVKLGQGESESDQIIMNSSKDVKNYELVVSDLYDKDGNVFSKNNISVYHQYYIEVYQKSRNGTGNIQEYPLGFYPDALIPQEYSIEYGENNFKKRNNQGITVDFTTTSETKPGVYSGAFTLKVDGKEVSIPVSVTVWDFDITYTNGFDLWELNNNFIVLGEKDLQNDVYTAYYEKLLKYKLSGYQMPNQDTIEGCINSLLKYYGTSGYSGFFLPDTTWLKPGVGYTMNYDRLTLYFDAILDICKSNNINYFTACAFYFQAVDEPWGSNEKIDGALQLSTQTTEFLNNYADMLEQDKTMEETFKKEICDTIRKMPRVVTSYYDSAERLQGVVTTFCPSIEGYETTGMRQDYEYNAQVTDGNIWTYTCLNPYYPYPTYHIDDYSVAGRCLGWIRKEYNITGYLNWEAAMSTKSYKGEWVRINPYEEPIRVSDDISFANGDGYLLYPGEKYNSDTPIPSLRLLLARDSQEDYDMLCLLEKEYDRLCELYGLDKEEYGYKNIYNYIFNTISNGVLYYKDESLIQMAREKIADLIVQAKQTNTLLHVDSIGGNYGKLEIYSNATAISINGVQADGLTLENGKRYSSIVKLEDGITASFNVAINNNGVVNTFNLDLPKNKHDVLFADDLYSENFEFTTGSSFDDQNKIITVKSIGDDLITKLLSTPRVKLNMDKLDLSDATSLQIKITNLESERVVIKLGMASGDKIYGFEDFRIEANQTYVYSLNSLSDYGCEFLDNITGLVFEFVNIDSNDELLADRNIKIEQISFYK